MAAAAALFVAGSAYAADQSQPQPNAVDAGNAVICKNQPSATGSRIGARKVCMTRNEWDQSRREAQEQINASQNSGRALNPVDGGN
jgi:hypothetical protein